MLFIQLVVWNKVSGDVVNFESVNNPRFVSAHENQLLVSTFGIQKQLLYTVNEDGTLTQVSVDVFPDISQSLANAFHNDNMFMRVINFMKKITTKAQREVVPERDVLSIRRK